MKRLLPVAVLFAVLLALVVAKEVSRGRLAEGPAPADEFVPLATEKFETKDAAKLEVFAPGATEPAFTLEKEGERWLMTKPFRAPAQTAAVEKLCDALATGDAEMRADDASALRDFDLVADRAVQVRVTGAGGKVLSHVGIGKTTGTRGSFVRFLASADDVRAFETTADLRGLLGLPRTFAGDAAPEAPKRSQFLDRDFPTVKLDNPARIEVIAPGRRVVLEKRGGAWTAIEGGPGLPVNKSGIEQVLKSVGPDFHASDLADPSDLGKLGLAEPRYVLAVTLEDGSVKRVVGAADTANDKYYARLDEKQDPDVVYEASSWTWQRIFPTGASLFTFENVPVPEDTLTKIVVERSVETSPAKGAANGEAPAATRIEMVRPGTKPSDDWTILAPDWPLVARQSSMRSLSSLVRNLRPIDWVDAKDLGPEEVVVRAGSKDAPESELTTLRIGGKAPYGKDRLAVLPKHEGQVFVLAESTVDRLAVSPTSLFEAKVLHGWAAADVKAVRVANAAGDGFAPEFAVESGDGAGESGWTLVRGEERTGADTAAVTKWLDSLLALETAEPKAGAEDPAAVRVTVEKKDGASVSIVLSAEKDGRRGVTLGTLRFTTDRADLVPASDALRAPAAPAPKKNGDAKEEGGAEEKQGSEEKDK